MKFKITKCLILILATVLLLCGCSAGANSTTQSSDGIVAVLSTDKTAYTGLDTAKVGLEIINNTGKLVAVSTQVKAPEGLKLNMDAVNGELRLEPGQRISLSEITVKMNPTGVIIGIILGVLAVAGGVFAVLFVIRKKKTKQITSMLLCIVMLAGLIVPAIPVSAAEDETEAYYSGSLTVSHPVTVDGREVKIEANVSYQIGIAEEESATEPDDSYYEEEEEWIDPDTDKPNAKVTAFFYNDYDGEKASYDAGATVNQQDQLFSLVADGDNGYMRVEIANELTTATYQADFKNNKLTDHFVAHFKLSTENQVPNVFYMLYRYCTESNTALFDFTEDGSLHIKKQTYTQYKLTPGQWLEMDLAFDLSPVDYDQCTFYVGGTKLTTITLPEHEEHYKIPYVRFHIPGTGNMGKTVLIDDFIVYEGKEILTIDEVNSPGYPYWPKPHATDDVAMELPDLQDLGDKVIAVAVGSDQAYVNGELITLSATAQDGSSGDVFTDALVPNDFLSKYLGVSGAGADQMHSILRYATGKNVLVDRRGMVVLTDGKVLDPEEDVKLLTMLYGYLTTGELVNNYAAAAVLSQNIIDRAVHEYDAEWAQTDGHSYPATQAATALYYMVLAARMDPDVTATDGTVVAQEAVARIKKLVSGGREPWASPGCYWGHAVISSALLLAKNTPVIWEQMTDDDIKRIDLLMECLAIAANWGYNAENDYKTGFDLTGNFGKTYNPNFKNAYHTCYLSAALYFDADGNGDGNELDEILTAFNYESYIARLTEVGFENILYCWTIVDIFGVCIGEYMQNGGPVVLKSKRADKKEQIAGAVAGDGVGVAVPFRYEDLQSKEVYDSSELLEMFIDTVEYTYSWEVTSGDQAPGSMYYAHTLTYADSPWEGQMGMMREFSSGDAGARSKVEYCYLSAINIAPLYANLKLLGYWDYDANPDLAQKMLEMDNRIYVGTEDMFFKMHEGYLGSANQTMVEEFEWKINQSLGAGYIKDIFMNFHFMKNEEIVMKAKEELKVLAERAEPKDGITEMPEGAIPARGRTLTQLYVTDFYTPIDPGKGYKSGGISFDVVLGDDLLDTEFNAVIALDKKYEGKTYYESPMLIQFKNGQISFMDDATYMAAAVKFGENYRYHFEMTFDCATGKYSGTVTQTWPVSEKPITASFTDYDFRTSAGQLTFVDSLMVVNQGDYNTLWVENVQVTGSDTVTPGEISKTVEIEVKHDWGNVPASKRPKEYNVNLTLNDMVSVKYVTFTEEDGWAAKTFSNLPATLNGYDAEWGISTDATIDRYYHTIVKTGDYSYTVKWSSTKYFYDNNFESWNKGEYQAANTPIYDKNNNILQDWYDGSSKSKLTQGRDSTGNRYMDIGGSKASQFTVEVDKDTKAQVYAFKMRLKLKNANSEVTGTHFAYRYSSDYIKHQFISINKNSLNVGGHSLGALSTDQWTEFEVILDFRTLTGEVFCGESTYRRTFDLYPIASNQIVMYASPNVSGLCLDDLQIYTKANLYVSKPEDEANKNAELIVPDTPIPELDPAFQWYYSADFEYWNKGKYKSGETPIKDAYGNVMIDQWSSSMGPLVRSEDTDGNHYLELTSPKPIQAVLNVDEAYDDGVYIIKWRMKLKDEESVSPGTVFSYRYDGMTKHNFASISATKTAICGAQLGALTAEEWLEVMVVLDFNTLTGTVCDWEGNKLGSTALYPITSSMFNIYASAGTSGLCIDDLQIFSGSVTITEPEPEPTDPSCIYNNDFEGQTVVAGDKDYYIPDSHGHIYQDNSDLFKTVVLEDSNTALEISNGGSNTTNFISVADSPDAVSIQFKVRLKDETVSVPANGFAIRYRAGSSRIPFANIGNNAVNIGSSSTALTTDWTQVQIFVDFANGKLQYAVGAETTGEMSFDPISGVFQLDMGYCTGVFAGLYLDDLIIRAEESAEPEEPTEPSEPSEPTEPTEPSEPGGTTVPTEPTEPTEPENSAYTWYYNNDFNGQTVTAGDKDYYIKDAKDRIYQNNSDLFTTVVLPDGNTVLEVANNGANATNFVALADQPTLLTIRFKARLKDAATVIPANGFAIRYRNASSRIPFATFGNNGFQVGGSNTALTTEWTDIKIIVDFAGGKLSYEVGAQTVGEVAFDPITGVHQLDFGYCTGTFAGLYLDDLQIYTGVYETEEAPTEPPADGDTIAMTVSVGWSDGNDADGLRPSSVYVSVYNGTTLVKREAVTKYSGWKYTFTDLPKYDDQNNVITYTVVVENQDVPKGYEASVNGSEVALSHTPAGNITWYYKNDFDGQTVTAGDKDYYMKDGENRVFQNNNDQFRTVTLEDGNTVLSLVATGSDTSFVKITDSPSSVTVKFRVRLAEETTSFTGRVLEIRYRDGKKPFAAFVDGNLDMSISTNNNAYTHRTPLSTQWIDVEMTLDATNGKIYYTVDGVTGEMTVSLGALTQLDFYSYTTYEGIYIDDLKIYTKNN